MLVHLRFSLINFFPVVIVVAVCVVVDGGVCVDLWS